jgi:hypothetical protein
VALRDGVPLGDAGNRVILQPSTFNPWILNPQPLNPQPLNPQLLSPQPSTLNPQPSNPQPSTPQPSTLNPSTLNPLTLNPHPSTLNYQPLTPQRFSWNRWEQYICNMEETGLFSEEERDRSTWDPILGLETLQTSRECAGKWQNMRMCGKGAECAKNGWKLAKNGCPTRL